uniref:Photosystem I reaction center subunit IX n=1 Tax=Cyanidium sp. THAL103 TaxID=3027999 RepID=A0A9Y1I473_9RHOD|nr:photosystem I subunit IX [Cyanidium sp. THAL103]
MNNNLLKYLSSVPVLATIWIIFTASLIIEINRLYPDILFYK